MSDITIDGKNYDYIDKCTIGEKNYIVFEDEECVYVNEYKVVNNQIVFINIDVSLQEQILRRLNLEYE